MDLADEFFHEPTDEEYWSESHYLDAVDVDAGVAFHTRIGFYPNQNIANIFAYLIVDEDIYWLREESVAPSDIHGLVAEADGWRFRMIPVDPPHEWEIEVEGKMKKTSADDPQRAVTTRSTTPTERLSHLATTPTGMRLRHTSKVQRLSKTESTASKVSANATIRGDGESGLAMPNGSGYRAASTTEPRSIICPSGFPTILNNGW